MAQLAFLKVILVFAVLSVLALCNAIRYEPNWKSLDSRPNPAWFDDVKYGIMMHWGVFSVPSFGHEWFWFYWKTKQQPYVNFVKNNYRPDWTYADFANGLTTEFYHPDEWADIIEASGAKYTAITTKHHEGYAMWPTKYSYSWNAMDVGPKRDLIGEFAAAIRKKKDIHFGIYHSLYEWFNPLYDQDKANHYKTQDHVKQKVMPQLHELIHNYKPDLLWSDGDWEAPSSYWNSTHFIAWLYNDSPVKDNIVTNDRWGLDANCHHGGYITCRDKYNPKVLQKRKWEDIQLCDKQCAGYRRESKLADYWKPFDIITFLVQAVSCGGNLILNVGITKEGRIAPILEERLRQVGAWLKVNGDAIYGTRIWKYQNDTVNTQVWYTSKKSTVYAIALYWPGEGLHLGAVQPMNTATTVKLVGYPETFKWVKSPSGGIDVTVPAIPFNKMPCDYAWVFQIDGLFKTLVYPHIKQFPNSNICPVFIRFLVKNILKTKLWTFDPSRTILYPVQLYHNNILITEDLSVHIVSDCASKKTIFNVFDGFRTSQRNRTRDYVPPIGYKVKTKL